MWLLLGVLGSLAVLTGALPLSDARNIAVTRAGPILIFLVAITVLAELADRAEVFDAAAGVCARLARGSSGRLFLLIAVLATVITIGMSLDTTAVLLTPVVLTVTDRLGLRPLPFAILVVWLANTASLLLPVSNLTNLLAIQREQLSSRTFAGRMALPELVAVALTLGYLGLLFRRDLSARFQPPEKAAPEDRWTFWVSAAACLALAPGVVLGAPPWAVAAACATAAAAVFALRQRRQLSFALVPWRIVILTEGLFLFVSALARHGLTHLLGQTAGSSTLASAVTAALASNGFNNLPAYLSVEPAVPQGHTTELLAVLVGTNTGPLVLLWGSLATLLWRERCRARGIHISAWKFAAIGLGGVPFVLVGSWGSLLLTS